MGMNFYFITQESEACPHCGRFDAGEKRHIGKSSAGWCFSLHVIPEDDINSLDDWKRVWATERGVIRDEYGDTLSVDDMVARIAKRSWEHTRPRKTPPLGYRSDEEFLRKNNAERGPHGLLRHQIDGQRCVGHGPGMWDLIAGEFS